MTVTVPVSGSLEDMHISALVNQKAIPQAQDVAHVQSRLLHEQYFLRVHRFGRPGALAMLSDDGGSQSRDAEEGGVSCWLRQLRALRAGEGQQQAAHGVQAASMSGWEHTEGHPVDVVQEPLHLAHIRAKGPGHISTAAISRDGQLIAFAGAAAGSLRLYRLSRADVRPVLCAPSRASANAPAQPDHDPSFMHPPESIHVEALQAEPQGPFHRQLDRLFGWRRKQERPALLGLNCPARRQGQQHSYLCPTATGCW